MTVGELIEKLKGLPQDAEVGVAAEHCLHSVYDAYVDDRTGVVIDCDYTPGEKAKQ